MQLDAHLASGAAEHGKQDASHELGSMIAALDSNAPLHNT